MYSKNVIKSGLRLITYPMPESEAVTAQVFFGTGSYFEDKSISGISHFLEHVFFKGSKKYPKPKQINQEIDKVGGMSNAFTGEEITSYFVKVSHEHTDLALDILSDVLVNPLFPEKEIEKERTVILEEMKLYEDDPDSKVGMKFEELVYGDQPAGRPIIGREEVIRRLTREDFLRYRKDHYHVENAVVVVTGRIEEGEIEERVGGLFSGIPLGKAKSRPMVVQPKSGPKVIIERRPSEQTKIILGMPAYSLFDKRRYVLGVLGNILGGTASSRLFMKIREDKGLAYSVYSYASHAMDTGVFGSFAGTEIKNAEQVVKLMRDEYKSVVKKGVTARELKMAKDNIIGRLGIGLETSDRWAGFLGGQEILENKILMPDDIADRISAVTLEEIKAVAADIFKPRNFHLALLGSFPQKSEDRFKKILAA